MEGLVVLPPPLTEKQNDRSIKVHAMIPGRPLWNSYKQMHLSAPDWRVWRMTNITNLEIPHFTEPWIEFNTHKHVIQETPGKFSIFRMRRKPMRLYVCKNRQEIAHEIGSYEQTSPVVCNNGNRNNFEMHCRKERNMAENIAREAIKLGPWYQFTAQKSGVIIERWRTVRLV